MSLLLTGSRGFIGSAIGTAASNRDVVRLQHAADYQNAEGNYLLDFGRPEHVDRLAGDLAGAQIEALVHCAAAAPFNTEGDIMPVNHALTRGVTELCNRLAVPQLVFTSGWIVYGITFVPVPESAPLEPATDYGRSKLEAESYFRDNLQATTLVTLRLASVYGVGQRSAGLIPNLARQGLAGEPIRIGSVQTRRDYLYIDDATAAVMGLLDRPPADHLTLNVGSGSSASVLEVAQTVQGVFRESYGAALEIELSEPVREGQPPDNRLDISAARGERLLTETVGLQAGLTKTIAWMKEEHAEETSR